MSDNHHIFVNASQIRAARGLLDWSQEDLATSSNVSIATVRKLESGHISPRDKTMTAIKSSLELSGIEFIPPLGVKLRTNDVNVFQGDDCFYQLLEDIFRSAKTSTDEILFINADGRLIEDLEYDYHVKIRKNGVKWRFLQEEGNTDIPYPLEEFRWLPKRFFKRNIQLIYGSKVAMGVYVDKERNLTTKIIVIDSLPLANSIRILFDFMWENCRKPTYTTAKKVYSF